MKVNDVTFIYLHHARMELIQELPTCLRGHKVSRHLRELGVGLCMSDLPSDDFFWVRLEVSTRTFVVCPICAFRNICSTESGRGITRAHVSKSLRAALYVP